MAPPFGFPLGISRTKLFFAKPARTSASVSVGRPIVKYNFITAVGKAVDGVHRFSSVAFVNHVPHPLAAGFGRKGPAALTDTVYFLGHINTKLSMRRLGGIRSPVRP